ncbi:MULTISPECIES: LysR family transcriptional regulator [Roseateles]|uniref:LysR family transcriptional regulator n=1 Tax=Pelomonas caseinilytica TaxID=2906763 RepID=A0ABS8XKC7_9BURK|nr:MULTISPECIES: LysR family transcriptional regulator [unclassified Roseateles]MCE4539024.1 LysR family transcriptional regulator [Pelomonas sp. P7]HEV6968452.1 LysR family transcriptional regulator [Roseateles sp.]
MDQLRAIKVFVRVIDEGSFAAAARSLDLAPAVVTRLVAELEDHLGTRLLNRTTRRLALTEIGEAYLERARRILADVDEAAALAASATQEVRGLLRVLCPPAIAVHQLAKHLPKFHREYPHVTLEITSPGPVDTVDDSYDLTILLAREPLDGDFIARRLARSEFIMCASPDYLDQRGRPQHPRDLKQHDALLPPTPSMMRGLTLQRGDGQEEITLPIVPSRATLSTTHMDTNYAAALHGLGVAGLPSFMVEDALLEQALERVMPQWRLFSTTLWAGMPSRKYVPARTRAFLDFLLEIFGGEDKDPWLVAAGCATCP